MKRVSLLVLLLVAIAHAQTNPPQFPSYTWTNPTGVIVKNDFNQVAAEIKAMEPRFSGRGTLAARPTASTLLTQKVYIVSDCVTNACTGGGGTLECVTRVNDAGSAWDAGPCEYPITGNGVKVASSAGTLTSNNCAKWDASGNIVDAGAACGTGGGGAFSSLTGGTNTTAAMVVGSGASLSTSGTGTVQATDVVCTSCINLASEITGTLPLANLTDNNTTSGLCLMSGGAGGDPAYATCPGAGGGAAFSAITSGTNTGAAMVVGSGATLDVTGTGTIKATNVVCTSCVDLTSEVTGTLPFGNGGTGLNTLGTAKQALFVNAGATALQYGALPCAGGGTGGGTGSPTCATGFDNISPIQPTTGKGQLIVGTGGAAGAASAALAPGSNGTCLQADSTVANGLKWATCGSGGSGNVTGPGPTVTANAVATFNGTGGLTIQASPCTIDTTTGVENCPAPLGTTQGAIIIKEGQGYTGGNSWTLTLGSGDLTGNYVCAIDPATGLIPASCVAMPGISQTGPPWTCASGKGGTYYDTGCANYCVCNPAIPAWCRSDTGACGSSTSCCAVGTTTTTTSTSSTTTVPGSAPSWVPYMRAFWTLDEASGTSRLDTSGNGYTLGESSATANDTTNKMQGTASAVFANSRLFTNASTILPTAPVSAGCWMRETKTSGGFGDMAFGSNDFASGGLFVGYDDANKRYTCGAVNATGTVTSCSVGGANTSTNSFTHVAVTVNSANTQACQFINGAANGGCATGTAIYNPIPNWNLGQVGSGQFTGNADECFIYNGQLSALDLCKICSCGVDGSLCTCSGASYVAPLNNGRNSATPGCGGCTLPACNSLPGGATTTTTTTVGGTTTTTSGGTYAFTVAGNTGTPQPITNGDTLHITGTNGIATTATATDTVSVSASNAIWADSFAGIDCSGASDSSVGWPSVTAALPPGGGTIFLKPGCILRAKSPGTTNPAFTIPSNTRVLCADETAGFAVDRQVCRTGQYIGAPCNTDAECLQVGGAAGTSGACKDDFGTASGGVACTATTCFAPLAPTNTYTLLKDTVGGNDITIENCSLFLAQASPYQACSVGATPCRKECDGAGTSVAGQRCEGSGDCPGGTCLRTSDCSGTCGGLPTKLPAGPGNIRAIDFSRTTRAHLRHVSVFDGFVSDNLVQLGSFSLVEDTDLAREATDCTSPLPGTPATSTCGDPLTNGGACCYGAAFNNAISAGNKGNTQPTVAVTQGLTVGANSQVLNFTKSRGTTAFVGTGTSTRFDETVVKPFLLGNDNTTNLGPGAVSTNGYSVGSEGQVTKSYMLNLGAGTCINMTGANSGVIGTKCASVAGLLKGIVLAGNNSHAMGNNIRGLNGSAAIGVALNGIFDTVSDTYCQGTSATGTCFDITANYGQVTGGNVVDGGGLLQDGVRVEGNNGLVSGNSFSTLVNASVHVMGSGSQNTITGNFSSLGTSAFGSSYQFPTATFHPVHVLNDGTSNQTVVTSNTFQGGWHAFATGTRTNGFTNTNFQSNRVMGLSGAPLAAGGAGLLVQNNYFNLSGSLFALGTWTSCDASCNTNQGLPCNADTDCGTCAAGVNKCRPEPVNGYIGSPTAQQGASHNNWASNVMFNGNAQAIRQCQGAGPIGQRCDVASGVGACAGAATCSGTPAQCQSGSDQGKPCCTTAGTGTCAVREPVSHLRVVDYGSGTSHSLLAVANNTFFGGDATNGQVIGIDMLGPTTGNLTLADWKVSGNNFLAPSATATTGIRFPTSYVSIVDSDFDGNSFHGYTNDFLNQKASMGSFAYPVKSFSVQADQALSSTSFVNVTDLAFPIAAGKQYFFNCEIVFSSNSLTAGLGLAMSIGGLTANAFDYIARIPRADSTTAGTDVMQEQEGQGNDATATATTSVGSTTALYTAAVRGNLDGASGAGTLQVRAKESSASHITIKNGGNCVLQQIP